jgi:hypothetical protein
MLASHEAIPAQQERVVVAWMEAPLEAANCPVEPSLKIAHKKDCT